MWTSLMIDTWDTLSQSILCVTETVIELALATFGNWTQIRPIIYLFHVAQMQVYLPSMSCALLQETSSMWTSLKIDTWETLSQSILCVTEMMTVLALANFGKWTQIRPIICFALPKGNYICRECHVHYCRKHRQCEQALRMTPERHYHNQYCVWQRQLLNLPWLTLGIEHK
jgi:hypothetical protein